VIFHPRTRTKKIGSLVSRERSSSGGDPLAERKPLDHPIIDQSRGMTFKPSVELRFTDIAAQVRDGSYPLHMAVESQASFSIVETMIKEAPEILLETNKFGETPLQLALKHHADDEMIKLMLNCEKRAIYMQDNIQGNTPIHTVALAGCSDHVAKLLLETWQDALQKTNAQGLTPLELAVSSRACSEGVVRLFEIGRNEVN
jgi:ankyrin repeat protein